MSAWINREPKEEKVPCCLQLRLSHCFANIGALHLIARLNVLTAPADSTHDKGRMGTKVTTVSSAECMDQWGAHGREREEGLGLALLPPALADPLLRQHWCSASHSHCSAQCSDCTDRQCSQGQVMMLQALSGHCSSEWSDCIRVNGVNE